MAGLLAFTRPDGGVTVRHYLTEKEKTLKKLPQGVAKEDVVDVVREEIPSDRYFRDAWKIENSKLKVDMPKARDIQLARIREKRDEKLKELDVETIKEVGKGGQGDVRKVEAQKQRLRDLPQTFDLSSATTPEDLKLLWPEEIDVWTPPSFN